MCGGKINGDEIFGAKSGVVEAIDDSECVGGVGGGEASVIGRCGVIGKTVFSKLKLIFRPLVELSVRLCCRTEIKFD